MGTGCSVALGDVIAPSSVNAASSPAKYARREPQQPRNGADHDAPAIVPRPPRPPSGRAAAAAAAPRNNNNAAAAAASSQTAAPVLPWRADTLPPIADPDRYDTLENRRLPPPRNAASGALLQTPLSFTDSAAAFPLRRRPQQQQQQQQNKQQQPAPLLKNRCINTMTTSSLLDTKKKKDILVEQQQTIAETKSKRRKTAATTTIVSRYRGVTPNADFLANATAHFSDIENNIRVLRQRSASVQQHEALAKLLQMEQSQQQQQPQKGVVVYIDRFSCSVVHVVSGGGDASPQPLSSYWKRLRSVSTPTRLAGCTLDRLPRPLQAAVRCALSNDVPPSSSGTPVRLHFVAPATPWRVGEASSWFSFIESAAIETSSSSAPLSDALEHALHEHLSRSPALVAARDLIGARTALHIAAQHNSPHLARLLMQHGADPLAREGVRGDTALHVASRYARSRGDVLQTLLNQIEGRFGGGGGGQEKQQHLVVNARNFVGETPLSLAAASTPSSSSWAISLLTRYGASEYLSAAASSAPSLSKQQQQQHTAAVTDGTVPNVLQWTPLHDAVFHNHTSALEDMMCAVLRGSVSAVDVFGANGIATTTQSGENALQIALRRGSVRCFELLVEFETASEQQQQQQQKQQQQPSLPFLLQRDRFGRNIFHLALSSRRAVAAGMFSRLLHDDIRIASRTRRHMLQQPDSKSGATPLEMAMQRSLRLGDSLVQDLVVMMCGGLFRTRRYVVHAEEEEQEESGGRRSLFSQQQQQQQQTFYPLRLVQLAILHGRFQLQQIFASDLSSLATKLSTSSSSSSAASMRKAFFCAESAQVLQRALKSAATTCSTSLKSIFDRRDEEGLGINYEVDPGERRKLSAGDAAFASLLPSWHGLVVAASPAASAAAEESFVAVIVQRTIALGSDAAVQVAIRGLSSCPEHAAALRKWVTQPHPCLVESGNNKNKNNSNSSGLAAAFARLPLWAVWWQACPIEGVADDASDFPFHRQRNKSGGAGAGAGRSPRVVQNFLRLIFSAATVALSAKDRVSICLSICWMFLVQAPKRCASEIQLVDFALATLTRDLKSLQRTAENGAANAGGNEHDDDDQDGVARAALAAASAPILPFVLQTSPWLSRVASCALARWLPAPSNSCERRLSNLFLAFSSPIYNNSKSSGSNSGGGGVHSRLPSSLFPLLPHLTRCYPRVLAKQLGRLDWGGLEKPLRDAILAEADEELREFIMEQRQ